MSWNDSFFKPRSIGDEIVSAYSHRPLIGVLFLTGEGFPLGGEDLAL
jgi:hypothetical protein